VDAEARLEEGAILRRCDREPSDLRLGIVIAPLSDEMIYVLTADLAPAFDVEVFVARADATGRDAHELALETMEPASDGHPGVVSILRSSGPHWWQVSAHLDGEHADASDPECPLCGERAKRG